jgi:AAA family ATP:ADP antiporter
MAFFGIEPGEGAAAWALFGLYFCIIAIFWCLKPLRTSGVVKAFGPAWYPLFKQGTALLMPFAVWGYSWLVDRVRRDRLFQSLLGIFAGLTLLFWLLFLTTAGRGTSVAYFFYVDVYNTVALLLFYTYLNDVSSTAQAKRLYGFIGTGGMVGAVTGSAASGWLSERLGSHILLVPLPFFLFGIWLLARLNTLLGPPAPPEANPGQSAWAPAIAGAKLVLRSPYLLAIVGIVGLYELASTCIDYIFTVMSSQAFSSRDAMAAYQGRVQFIASFGGLFTQLFVVSWVHRRLGLKAGLLALPVTLLAGCLAFALAPGLLLISVVLGAEATLQYTINQNSKEVLYTPTDRETRYKAKAFIDMFVFRVAKGVSGILLILYGFYLADRGFDLRFLAGCAVVLILGWLASVVVAARHFQRLEAAPARVD